MKKRQKWDRLIEKGEGPEAHNLFLIYVELGFERSPVLVSEKTGRRIELVKSLSVRFQWFVRAKAYDNYLLKIEQKAIENTVKTEGVLWAQREVAQRHNAWNFAEELLAKAREMLQSPLYQTMEKGEKEIIVDGKMVKVPVFVIFSPAKWTLETVAKYGDLADKLQRLSLNKPTSNTAVSLTVTDNTLEERVVLAKAAMKIWRDTRLNGAVQRILAQDPSQDAYQIRIQLLAEAPGWFAADYKILDPSLLVDYVEEEPPPLPLMIEEKSVN